MNMQNYFSISRFWLLLKMEMSQSRKGVLMTLVIIFGFLFFVGLLLAPVIDPSLVIYDHSGPYAVTLLAGGFLLSSLGYRDLGSSLRRYRYLSLPVSAFEKFLSMWLLTSVGWIILYTTLYTLYTLFANTVGQLLFSELTFETFNPLGPFAFKFMRFYFVLHGIFLAGAAHFRGFAFPKTLLTLILFGAVCGLISYFILKDMFNFVSGSESKLFTEMAINQIWLVIQWLFWWLLAPLCWMITFLGLKEQEV